MALLLLPILLALWQQNPPASPVVAESFRWFRDRQAVEKIVLPARVPPPAMIEPEKSIGRDARTDGTKPIPDPNREKIETRSGSLDEIAAQASESHQVAGFTYEVKFRNTDSRQTLTIFWEYQFKDTQAPENITRHRFACPVKIKPDKEKVIEVFSTLSPGGVINVKSLSQGPDKQFDESVVIDRIEFEDGSDWQRPDWNFAETKPAASKRERTGVCRSF